VYLREDLQTAYDRETVARASEVFPPDRVNAPDAAGLPLGDRRAAVFYHERAVLIQLRYTEVTTVLISLRPETAGGLLEFIEACRTIIDDPTPHADEAGDRRPRRPGGG